MVAHIEENRKQDISGKKIWKDVHDYRRPESIIIKLLQDGVEYGRCEVTEDSNWKYRFENIPVYKNSELEKYEYRIEEEKVPYYEAKYNGKYLGVFGSVEEAAITHK